MESPDEQKAKVVRYVKWGAMALVAVLVAPITYAAAISVIEATVAIGAAVITIGVIWTATPVVSDWLGNMRMKAVIALAEANPIETMVIIYSQKASELATHQDAITEFDTQYRNVDKMVTDLTKTDPEESKSYADMRDKMRVGLDELRHEQTDASAELKTFKNQIDKAQRIYKVALAMNKALVSSQSAQAAVFMDIKKQVSFDTVTTTLNKSFAKLDSAIENRRNNAMNLVPTTKQITGGPVVTDFKSTPIKEGVSVN